MLVRMTTDRAPEKLVRFRDACRELGMGERTGYRHIAENTFPIEVLKIGGIWKVRRSDLDGLLVGKNDDLKPAS